MAVRTLIRTRFTLALGLLCAALTLTSAEAGQLYAGAAIGESELDLDALGTDFQTDDNGLEVFLGKRFLRFLAVELGYTDLGDFQDARSGGTLDASGDFLSVSALGLLPVSPRLDLYGKVSWASWDTEATITSGSMVFPGDDDGTDIGYGAGLIYGVTKRFALRLEWEEYEFDRGDDVRFGSLGIQFEF